MGRKESNQTNKTINHFNLKLSIFVAILQVLKFEFQKFRILEILNVHPMKVQMYPFTGLPLTRNDPITTKVICFSHLLKCLRSLYDKQCGPRSDCSYRVVCSGSRLFAILKIISNARQFFAADNFGRQHFQMHFFLSALRVNKGLALSLPVKDYIVCSFHLLMFLDGLQYSKHYGTRSDHLLGSCLIKAHIVCLH